MKKYLLILVAFVVFCANAQSQAPQRFNYQVIARDADGNPLLNQSVNFRISILQGSAAGTAVYIETHALTTNDFGMATMAIGAGAVVTGVFSSIGWGTDSYYVRTELDPTGGTSFTFAGVTQLLSVPYALYANSSGSGGSTYTAGTGIDITGSIISNTMPNAFHSGDVVGEDELTVVRIQGRSVIAPYPTNGQTLIWNATTNAWVPSFDGLLPSGMSGQTLHHDGTNWIANSLLFNDNVNIGIGTTSPTALLHTEGAGSGKGNVLFEGDTEHTGFGSAPTEGAGTRLMWYPDKAAFRAGTVDDTQWNTGNIGENSVALGSNNLASGVNSVAFGHDNDASGNYSTAMGSFTTASGASSIASGHQTFAVGDYSSAFGYRAQALGENSTAMGNSTHAPSVSETVLGRFNTYYLPSVGGSTVFNPLDRLFVIGNGTSETARSNAMTILKNGNTGLGTSTPQAQLHTTGTIRFTGAGTPGSGKVLTSDEVGNATWQTISGGGSLPSGTNGQTLRHDGSTWVANSLLYNDNSNIGVGTTTPSALFHVNGMGMGNGNVVFTGDAEDYLFGPAPATGAGTRMMWYPDKAAFRAGKVNGTEWDTDNIGIGSIAMGVATQATNYNTTALGLNSIASGSGATAIGEVVHASGQHSFALGYASNATETYSYAFGNQVTASGPQSLALGNHSTASGTNSVAIGTDAYATGYLSKSIGFDCHATGNHAVALGDFITAPSMSETVIGNYNTSYVPIEGPAYFHPLDRLFVIGNGTSTSARSNALTMLKNGNTGLGTDFPEAQLHTTGSLRFEGAGTPGIGKVLTSDEVGNATWQTISGGGSLPSGYDGQTLRHDGSSWVANSLLYNNSLSIGIGTTAPTAQLHTKGSVRFEGAGAPGAGKVLTSDALGNATWQTVSGSSLPSGTTGQTLRHDGSTWVANNLLYNNSTSIGIGTTSPSAQLHTTGSVRLEGAGTPGEGKVLTSDASGNATWKGYSVGDYAQGGIIFWLDETGQHGLVACKFDQSPFSKWYAGTYGATRATGDGPLSGELNTGIIISSHVAIGDDGSLYAARICADVKLGEGPKTYGDWYLPTLNELWEMYMNRDLINTVAIAHGGNALSGEYWSSTEFDSNTAWKLSFSGGAYLQSDKAEQNRVRAIRAF